MESLLKFIKAIKHLVKNDLFTVEFTLEDKKEVLGMWLGKSENSSFWMSALINLRTRGRRNPNACCQ